MARNLNGSYGHSTTLSTGGGYLLSIGVGTEPCALKASEEKQQYKDERKAITEHITPLRKKLKQAVQIYNKSPRLIDLLGREYQIERKTYERTR